MMRREEVIEKILEAFGGNEYPGDEFLQGSFEGCEPEEEAGAFKGKTDWKALDPAMLDAHYTAPNFFSEAAFRFFLPAYLIADLRGGLQTAEPLFHLTGGFSVTSVEVPGEARVFVRRTGGATLLNPRRYGGITFVDYARYRLSVFSREEAGAIVAYLNYKRENDTHGIETARIDEALKAFWLERAERAPTRERLKAHLWKENEFVDHIRRKSQNRH